jgi:murein DD-endopeptidase MepM/ murein hydrolase activator NlpD
VRDAARELFDSRTPRERYRDALVAAGLGNTALVRDWLNEADRALREAPLVNAPHVEEGLLAAADAMALGYRVSAKRGQEILFEMALASDTTTTLYIDVWYVDSRRSDSVVHVNSADSGQRTLRHKPRRDGVYIVRAQPELLRAGRFTATVRIAGTLAFPVRGGREHDIGSSFGDSRDGGSRSHHGIDIFAPRGTPVLAAAPGVVTRVGEIGLGGNVVWMHDRDGNRLYYAHLDRWHVNEGDAVEIGDTLGFVGNTGNARTTPPHLHFGVYRRGEGPMDPFWFVHQPSAQVPRLVADTSALGRYIGAARTALAVRSAPGSRADTAGLVTSDTSARVIAATGEWYRVRLADGATGYVRARETGAN